MSLPQIASSLDQRYKRPRSELLPSSVLDLSSNLGLLIKKKKKKKIITKQRLEVDILYSLKKMNHDLVEEKEYKNETAWREKYWIRLYFQKD